MGETIFRLKRTSHILSLLSPDVAPAISTTNQVFLVIYRSEEYITSKPSGKGYRCSQRRQLDRVACKILRLQGVNCRQPDHGAPGQIEAEVVVAHVNGTEVPNNVSGV